MPQVCLRGMRLVHAVVRVAMVGNHIAGAPQR